MQATMTTTARAGAVGARDAVRVRICGGLGNQMLQYAAGRALALRLACPLELDLSFYGRDRHRSFELDRLAIQATYSAGPGRRGIAGRLLRAVRPSPRGVVYEERDTRFDPAFEQLEAPVELRGYFFSEKYFAAYADQIRQELTPPAPSHAHALGLGKAMSDQGAAALHVRRGDYVSNAKAAARFAHCTMDYYEQGMSLLPQACPVYVFSDDVAWARQNLPAPRPLEFVDSAGGQDGLRDLWLMHRAQHHIIANSSFSWWGAWLAGQSAGVTIAPAKWYNDPAIDDHDMIPPGWRRL